MLHLLVMILHIPYSNNWHIGARELVYNSCHTDTVEVLIGDGLSPLLLNDWKCDTIVVAGIGANRTIRILGNNPNVELYGDIQKKIIDSNESAKPVYYNYARPRIVNLSHLDSLGINRIIVQPWPPNILPVHAMHTMLLDNGWQFGDQGVDVTSNHHLTTCFIRSQEVKRIIVSLLFK